jgi:hypothetical protein
VSASDNKPMLYVYDERQSVAVSLMRDLISFSVLVGSAVALNTLMPPSGWLNATLGIAWILWLLGRGIQLNKHMTPQQAMDWLREQYPDRVK